MEDSPLLSSSPRSTLLSSILLLLLPRARQGRLESGANEKDGFVRGVHVTRRRHRLLVASLGQPTGLPGLSVACNGQINRLAGWLAGSSAATTTAPAGPSSEQRAEQARLAGSVRRTAPTQRQAAQATTTDATCCRPRRSMAAAGLPAPARPALQALQASRPASGRAGDLPEKVGDQWNTPASSLSRFHPVGRISPNSPQRLTEPN